MNRSLAGVFACSLVCLLCVGCGDSGPPLGAVTGKVTMDGQPLANVLVTFVPEGGGRAATGTTDANGQYELLYIDRKGALLGKHKVSVTTIQTGQAATEMSSTDASYEQQAMGGSAADYNKAASKETIPVRYNTRTELVKEVSSGSNEINLELTSSG